MALTATITWALCLFAYATPDDVGTRHGWESTSDAERPASLQTQSEGRPDRARSFGSASHTAHDDGHCDDGTRDGGHQDGLGDIGEYRGKDR